jgi:hypothetical protein
MEWDIVPNVVKGKVLMSPLFELMSAPIGLQSRSLILKIEKWFPCDM